MYISKTFRLIIIIQIALAEPPTVVVKKSRRQKVSTLPFYPTIPPIDYSSSVVSDSYGVPSDEYEPPNSNQDYGPPVAPPILPEYGAPSQITPAPIIHKHIYVHVPPPEPEYTAPPRPIAPQPIQKHYRIIFIKAPSAPAVTTPLVQTNPLREEKTIVYVLVKKPDPSPAIEMPTPASTVPSKPEVYFIRYKTKEEEATTVTIEPELVTEGGPYGY